jgi:hypothetical protein
MSKNIAQEKTNVLYDNTYIGECPGYFIITERDDQIIRFVKIYESNGLGFPYLNARAYEVGSIDQEDQEFRDISFMFNKNDDLFEPVLTLANKTKQEKISTVSLSSHGRNYMKAYTDGENAYLTFAKDIYWDNSITNHVDISMGDDILCKHYPALLSFYQTLSEISPRKAKKDEIEKIKSL